MLNIEKYIDELKKCGTGFALTQEGIPVDCDDMQCVDCLFKGGKCIFKRIEWLSQEYKESVLTDEAKSYLKLILEPSKCIIIQKLMEGEELPRKYKLLCSTDSGYIAILYKPGTKYYEYFKNMESDKAYTPEELGLC